MKQIAPYMKFWLLEFLPAFASLAILMSSIMAGILPFIMVYDIPTAVNAAYANYELLIGSWALPVFVISAAWLACYWTFSNTPILTLPRKP